MQINKNFQQAFKQQFLRIKAECKNCYLPLLLNQPISLTKRIKIATKTYFAPVLIAIRLIQK